MQYRFYELTGDLQDALHFRDFEQAHINLAPAPASAHRLMPRSRVRLKDEVKLKGPAAASAAHKHVKLRS